MRPSHRGKVLEAAVRVAERGGVTAVTLESVAAEAGLTKSGLMYHFPSREALLMGVQEHLAASWEALMVEAAGKPAEEATWEEKVAAYAHVATHSATRAELAFILEYAKDPDMSRPWTEVVSKWIPSAGEVKRDGRLFDLLVARLAADGLWISESLQTDLGGELRSAVAERIATMISAPGGQTGP